MALMTWLALLPQVIILGFLVFGDWPNAITWTGIAVIYRRIMAS